LSKGSLRVKEFIADLQKQLIIQIEIEKNESAARRRRIEHYIAMLENVKAKPDAALAHNAIDARKDSGHCPGGFPSRTGII
jgi:hypothetical protein